MTRSRTRAHRCTGRASVVGAVLLCLLTGSSCARLLHPYFDEFVVATELHARRHTTPDSIAVRARPARLLQVGATPACAVDTVGRARVVLSEWVGDTHAPFAYAFRRQARAVGADLIALEAPLRGSITVVQLRENTLLRIGPLAITDEDSVQVQIPTEARWATLLRYRDGVCAETTRRGRRRE